MAGSGRSVPVRVTVVVVAALVCLSWQARAFAGPLADAVARAGFKGLMKGKRLIIPGLFNKLTAFSHRITPRGMILKVVKWIQG